jgi:hypothetical protein
MGSVSEKEKKSMRDEMKDDRELQRKADEIQRKADEAMLRAAMDRMIADAKAFDVEYAAMSPAQRAAVDKEEEERVEAMFNEDSEEGFRNRRDRNLAHDAFESFKRKRASRPAP